MLLKCHFFLLCFLIFTSCAQQQQPAKTSDTPQSATDSLYKAVIHYHDETMPKMGKLLGYQKTLQVKLDSLNKVLKLDKNIANQSIREKYNRTLAQLQTAEKAMNDWMDGFEPDPQITSKDSLLEYWTREEAKARKMRDEYLSALDSAKMVLEPH